MAFDVFISYPHQEKAAADAACARLEAEGIRCWIAPRDITPSAAWAASIVDAIDKCRAMVLIFSTHTNQSKQVHREVQQAFDGEKPVIPLRIEDVKPEQALRYYMGSVHWLDALTPPLEQHLNQLVVAVRSFVQPGAVGTPDKETPYRSPISRVANYSKVRLPRLVTFGIILFVLLGALTSLTWWLYKSYRLRSQMEARATLHRLIVDTIDKSIATAGEWKGQPVAYSSKLPPKALVVCLVWRDTTLTYFSGRNYMRTGSSRNPPPSIDIAVSELKAFCAKDGCSTCVLVDRNGENALEPPLDWPY
jgi:hypothetical protein